MKSYIKRFAHHFATLAMVIGLLAPLVATSQLTFAQESTPAVPPPPEASQNQPEPNTETPQISLNNGDVVLPGEPEDGDSQVELNDVDGDSVANDIDNCAETPNLPQMDIDQDGHGDTCDADIDGDGLDNASESQHGTNPTIADSDGDGLLDSAEVQTHQTNPLLPDSDGDLISDSDEIDSGTDPLNPLSQEPQKLERTPVNPVETAATCIEGSLTAPTLPLTNADGITYRTEPSAPYVAGQTITVIASLDNPETTEWSDVLPLHWQVNAETGEVFREIAFSGVLCEPVGDDAKNPPVEIENGEGEPPNQSSTPTTITPEVDHPIRSENNAISTPAVETGKSQQEGASTPEVSRGGNIASTPDVVAGNNAESTPVAGDRTNDAALSAATPASQEINAQTEVIATPVASPQAAGMSLMSIAPQSSQDDCEVNILGTVSCDAGSNDVVRHLSVIPVQNEIMYSGEPYNITYHIRSSHSTGDLHFKVRIQLPVADQNASYSVSGDGNLGCQKVVEYSGSTPIGVSLNCAGALPPYGETQISVTLYAFTNEDAFVVTECGLVGSTNPEGGFIQTSGIWVYPDGESFPPSEGIFRATTARLACENQQIVMLFVDLYQNIDSSSIDAGQQIGFKITAASRGTVTAEDVEIFAWLPTAPGMNWVSSSEFCEIKIGLVTCELASIPAGDNFVVNFTSSTTMESCGFHTFTAMVSSPVIGTSDQRRYTAQQQVDCDSAYFTISPSDNNLAPGQSVDFDISIFNGSSGPDLTNLSFKLDIDDLPGSTWTVIDSADFSKCEFTGGSSPDTSLNCNGIEEGIPDLSAVTVKIRAVPDKYECGQIELNGEVSPLFLHATSKVEVDCLVRPDIENSFTTADNVVVVGEEISFTYTFANYSARIYDWDVHGPSLPGGDWNLTTSGPFHRGQMPYVCYTTNGSFECKTEIGVSFPATQTGTLTISRIATAEDCGHTYGGSVELISYGGDEGRWTSNTATVQVLCHAIDASISGPQSVAAGEEISYEILLTNRMASETSYASIYDELPETGNEWTTDRTDVCSFSSNIMNCDSVPIVAGEGVTITLTSTIEQSACDSVANTAWVDGAQTNTVLTTVICGDSSLLFSRGVADPVIAPGEDAVFVYQVIIPDGAEGGTVTLEGDVLPAKSLDDWSMTMTGDLTDGCTVDTTFDPYVQIVCNVLMDPGDSGTITVMRPVTRNDCGEDLGGSATATLGGASIVRDATIRVGCTEVSASLTGPGSGRIADELNYILRFTNLGNIDATITSATIQFPIWGNFSTTSENCREYESPARITCTNLTIPPNGQLEIPIVIQVADAQAYCGDRATLQAHFTDSDGNSGTTQAIQLEFDCSPMLNIQLDVQEIGIGSDTGYTHKIRITNSSRQEAIGVIMTDQLPDVGTVEVTNPATGCTVSTSNLVTCPDLTVPSLDDSTADQIIIELTYVVPNDFSLCGQFNNVAYYQVEEGGTLYASNVVIKEVDCDTGLRLTQTGGAKIEPGGEATETIHIYNLKDEKSGVSVEHHLPTNVTFEEVPDECVANGNLLTCENLTIPKSSLDHLSYDLPFTYKAPLDYACGSEITRSAFLTWSTFTIQGASITTDVVCTPNLAIEKSGDTKAERGDIINYTITVSNSGTGDATDVTVKDDLPDTGSVSTESEGCEVRSGNVVSCDGLTIPAFDGEIVIEIGYTTPTKYESCRDITNIASYQLGINDPVSSDAVLTDVTCGNNVRIQTSSAPTTINYGDQLEFTVDVTNSGDSTARGVSFSTTLPTGNGLDWTIAPLTQSDNCVLNGSVLDCENLTLTALGEGENRSTITVKSPTSYMPDEVACADGYTVRSTLSGGYTGEASATTFLSDCDRAALPTFKVILAECVDWSVTDSGIEIDETGEGVSVQIDPVSSQDGTLDQSFTVTLMLDAGYAWPLEMHNWTVDGNTASRSYEISAATCPPRPVPAGFSITSSDPTSMSAMPEGSTWRITRINDNTVVQSGTFTGDQLQLPAKVSIPEPLLPGNYQVEIDAAPAFDTFSEEFSITNAQTSVIGIMGLASQPRTPGGVVFAAQTEPTFVSFDIILQVADHGDGDGGTTPTPDDGDGGTTPTPDDGDGGTTPTPDDGDNGTSPSPTPDNGTSSPPDEGENGTTPIPGTVGQNDGSDTPAGSGVSETDGNNSSMENAVAAGSADVDDLVSGFPNTGTSEQRSTSAPLLFAVATAMTLLLAGAIASRRRN